MSATALSTARAHAAFQSIGSTTEERLLSSQRRVS
jgi:hypothetical protein